MVNSDVLLVELQRLADHLGHPPRQKDVNDLTARSHTTYAKEFGGWNDALEAANVGVNARRDKNRITLTCDAPDCSEEFERLPKDVAGNDYNYCSQACLSRHKSDRYAGTDNPNSTLQEVECDGCGSTILRARWERERHDRAYCGDCWGDSQRTVICEWCGDDVQEWPARVDDRRFCSSKCLGAWRSVKFRGADHPRWKEGRRPGYYGPNWHQQRRRALVRDRGRCQSCGLTDSESVERYGEQLSVHHITPLREYVSDGELDHEAANRLENLVTLCRSCHSRREGE